MNKTKEILQEELYLIKTNLTVGSEPSPHGRIKTLKAAIVEVDKLRAENKRLRAEIQRLNPPHKHDHDYYHDDCGLCQIEKAEYQQTAKALAGWYSLDKPCHADVLLEIANNEKSS